VLKLYEDFLEGRDMDIQWKRKELANVVERLHLKQLELQEYLKRRRIMEVYRDRLQAAYLKEENRRERVALDETATQMWFREAQWQEG
jgi:flagellar export protein FliJ